MNDRLSARLRSVAVPALVIISLLEQGCREDDRGPGRSQVGSSVESRQSPTRPDPSTIRRYQEIESRRAEIERTLFQPELEAERREAVFISLWDQCRRSPESLVAAGNFRLGKMVLGTPGEAFKLEDDMVLRRFVMPHHTVSFDAWLALVRQWEENGYRLEQSEWRQPEFRPGTNSGSVSTIFVRLHIRKTATEERFVLRGNLHVEWETPQGPNDTPVPRLIDATQLELLSRTGPPAFARVLAKVVTRQDDSLPVDPLIAYDLDGDGLSELILVCGNVLYRNGGNGTFHTEKLCQFFPEGVSTGVIADFDGDARADLLAADPDGLFLFRGDAQGKFSNPPVRVWVARERLLNPFVLTAGDVDGDGDLDVWLAQYKLPYREGQMPTPYYNANDGFPAYFLVNGGHGKFRDETERSGLAPKRFRRAYSSSFVDLDGDGDLDLVMVSDFAGLDIFMNDGTGKFQDVTRQVADETHAFGMAHSFGDYNLDGRLDLFVVGMNSFVAQRLDSLGLGPAEAGERRLMRQKMAYGNRLLLADANGFRHTSLSADVARSGWSWGATSFDFDNDGDLDIYVANGHKSRATARDYETQFWMHDIDAAGSEHDPALDLYFRATATRLYGLGYSYGGYEKNRLFVNARGKSFVEAAYLAGVSLELDCRNVVSEDLDGDGKLDLVVMTHEVWPKVQQAIHVFRNEIARTGNWIGFRLRESGDGFSPVGARVTLQTPSGKMLRHLVTGDSYRSQHSNTAHFGLGTEEEVQRAEIRWPNGKLDVITAPQINLYHEVGGRKR